MDNMTRPTPLEPPEDDRPTGPVPNDPALHEAWKERFTDDLMAGEPGGVDIPWRKR